VTINELLKAIRCTQIVGLDYETFWADDYTLKKQATTDYIYDDRFEMQLGAVMTHRQTKAKALERKPFQAWVKTVDWANTALLAHHTQFDALIAYRHFGVKPKFYLDTLSMARAVMPVTVGGSLHKVAQAFGLPGKRYGDALVATKNRRWADFTKDEKANLKTYAGDDIEQTFEIFKRLLPFVPLDELRLIDATVKMYANPRLLLDEPMLLDLARREVERKQALMDKLGVTPTVLQSNDKFAQLLEAYGVQPPTKVSAKTGKVTWAFAKNDLEFKELLEHDDENVRALMEARFGVKSTMVETRAFKMATRAKYGPQPIYLNYCGAGTTRWSGGDSANWQNLARGSDLRKAIMAPPGFELVIADLAQIEARVNAWFSGQQDIVDAFARGDDVYCIAASAIFGRKVTKADEALRFVGKTAVLGLGYGAGAPKFQFMLKTAKGPEEAMRYAASLSESVVRDIHRGWRQANPFIVANWKATENLAKSAFFGGQLLEHGCVRYQGRTRPHDQLGLMHLPNGLAIRYDDVQASDSGMDYLKKHRVNKTKDPTQLRQKLYGALLVENRTQALARIVVATHALQIADALGDRWQLVMTTHDELVGVVPKRSAAKALRTVKDIMSTPPDWAKGLPVAVDAHTSARYDK